jgi:hypothetical protein
LSVFLQQQQQQQQQQDLQDDIASNQFLPQSFEYLYITRLDWYDGFN